MNKPVYIIATGLYTGRLPYAPGTWATLLIGIPLCLALNLLGNFEFFIALTGIFFLSVYSAGFIEKQLKEKDPSLVVIDEIAGYLVSMILIPISAVHVICAFALFRLFDILKPYPIRIIEHRFPGGWGITLDDIMAGLYANIIMHLFVFFY